MDDYIISGAELTAIADAIRSKSGNTDSITPEDMPEEIMMLSVGNEPTLESIEVDPKTEIQTIKPSSGYQGLSQVTVNPIQTQEKITTINGRVTPDEGKYLTVVTVNVPNNGVDTSDATATAADILKGTSAYVNGEKLDGTHVCEEGVDTSDATATAADIVKGRTAYAGGGKLVGTHECDNADLGTKNIVSNGEYSAADDSLDGYSSVTVNVQPALQSLVTVTPDDTQHVIDPEDGYDGLRRVVVQPVPTQEKTVTTNGEVTPDSGKYLSKVTVNVPASGVDTSDATATESDIVKDKTAYVNGNKITGNLNELKSGSVINGTVKLFGESPDKSQLIIDTALSDDQLVREGGCVRATIELTEFGDATAEYVAAGKTFTSIAGYLVTGTFVDNSLFTETEVADLTIAAWYTGTANGGTTVSYADAATVEGGEIILVNTSTKLTSSISTAKTFAGKYVTNLGFNSINKTIYRIPEDAVFTLDQQSNSQYLTTNIITCNKAYELSVKSEGSSEAGSGLDTSDATATVSDILSGKTAYVNGEKITGTHECDVVNPVLESKTIQPSTQSITVVPSDGYDGLSQVVVEAMPTANQATPTITVDSNGKITATATQSAGYVVAGTKTATKQLTTKGAATITPNNTAQEIAAGTYLTGKQTISAVPTQEKTVVANGTVTPDTGKYLSKVTVNVPASGIDTSDATATASDMASGVTAYVNGEKVTGTLTTYGSDQITAFVEIVPTVKDDSVALSYVIHSDRIYRKGATIRFQSLKSQFGDATAADVAAGKTFTSASGLKVTGTATGGSGATIGTATTTPSSSTTTITFTGLSAEPKMFTLLATNNFSVNNTTKYVTSITYNGQSIAGITTTRTGSYTSYAASHAYTSSYTWSYTNGTLTITSSSASESGNFRSGIAYHLTYVT